MIIYSETSVDQIIHLPDDIGFIIHFVQYNLYQFCYYCSLPKRHLKIIKDVSNMFSELSQVSYHKASIFGDRNIFCIDNLGVSWSTIIVVIKQVYKNNHIRHATLGILSIVTLYKQCRWYSFIN